MKRGGSDAPPFSSGFKGWTAVMAQHDGTCRALVGDFGLGSDNGAIARVRLPPV